MEIKRSLSAIILAGGQSSRMGQDKALIPIQGIPLLKYVCDVAQQCANKVYIVTPWTERYQEILIAKDEASSTVEFIKEVPIPGIIQPQGPLVGFAQGLANVQTDWALLLACDLPQLQAEILQNWAKELVNVPQEAIAFLPKQPKGWEPLCGFYRRSSLPLLTQFINHGGRSFQYWLAQNIVAELPLKNANILFNCNTPADLVVLEAKKLADR